ncbi:unnamed protein product [Schistosoma mattheei]|uniref:Uncharacterized protein n=1 Tax=Schistosoma mattheei TaxID=31246 RepID=A0A183PXD6_9TREM|nr:unnamed protein product [Schistosoma mattheei]
MLQEAAQVRRWRKGYKNRKVSGCKASTKDDAEATLGEAQRHLNRLQICCTSARILLNKLSELGIQIDSTNPDIIAATETWLTQATNSIGLDFKGFTL